MDLSVACAILGVGDPPDLAEAKAAYRRRAKLVHPDHASADSRREAERAMSQLSEAWTTIQNSQDAAPATTRKGAPAREALDGECTLCGTAPAAPIDLRHSQGLLIGWRTRYAQYDLCRGCARAVYGEAQASSLTRGWWHLLSPLVNNAHLVRNRLQLAAHRRAARGAPARAPEVVTPLQAPMRYRSPWFRLSSVAATVAAGLLFAAVISAWLRNVSQPYPAPITTTPPEGVGACISSDMRTVNCSDPAAKWRLTDKVASPSECTGLG